jgi:hypothetical protein
MSRTYAVCDATLCAAVQVALNRMSLARGEPRYNDLAISLAKAVHRRFVWSSEGVRGDACNAPASAASTPSLCD